MRARIYVNTELVGIAEVVVPKDRPSTLRLNDKVTVVFVEEHPRAEDPVLFVDGRVESA